VVALTHVTKDEESIASPIHDPQAVRGMCKNDSYSSPLDFTLEQRVFQSSSTKSSDEVHVDEYSSPQSNCDNDGLMQSIVNTSIDTQASVDDRSNMRGCFNFKGSSHRIRVGYETWRALMPTIPVCSLQRTRRANMIPTRKVRAYKQ
jgi:hypothetical protein